MGLSLCGIMFLRTVVNKVGIIPGTSHIMITLGNRNMPYGRVTAPNNYIISLMTITSYVAMKSTKVQNPRRILHILRSMPMRVHRACAGFGQKQYACALFIIDGLGHATWSSKMPVSRSGTAPF